MNCTSGSRFSVHGLIRQHTLKYFGLVKMPLVIIKGLKYGLLVYLLFLLFSNPVFSEIYQYKDENGNLRFTDTPPPDAGEVERLKGAIETPSESKDIRALLRRKYAPAGGVEAATLATVTVTSPAGKGSGFFIRNDGYLITNKHVLRGDAEYFRQAEVALENLDNKIETADQTLEKEADALEAAVTRLENFGSGIRRISPARREAAQAAYEIEEARVNAWKVDFENRKRQYEAGKETYAAEKSNFNNRKLTIGISNQFTITLKDGTEIDALLVGESRAHDLALLKVNGYTTPHLSAARQDLRQGETVYAIGNPVELRDTVSRGILSGYENSFLKTDAKIYPGNSGGPLINGDGEVLGINTFKQLTRNFEGLGFAIPIKTALEEFKEELK